MIEQIELSAVVVVAAAVAAVAVVADCADDCAAAAGAPKAQNYAQVCLKLFAYLVDESVGAVVSGEKLV